MLTFDIQDGADQDLLTTGVRKEVEDLIDAGAVKCIGAGPDCGSMTEAITPPWRTKEFPAGRPGLNDKAAEKVRKGNSHARWTARLMWIARDKDILMWTENPGGSWLWRQKEWKRLISRLSRDISQDHPGGHGQRRKSPFYVTDFCRYGRLWRKRTHFLFVCGRLQGKKDLCTRDHTHLVLRGHHDGVHLTHIAEPYPMGLAARLAKECCEACGWEEAEILSPQS